MKIKNILIPCFLVCMITACNPGGGDTPKPGPEPTPEVKVNYQITASGATIGTTGKSEAHGTMDKGVGFSVTFNVLEKYKPLTASCFTVTIGKQTYPSGEGWTFNENNNMFTMEPNYVVNDLDIKCKAEPVDPPTEKYKINFEVSNATSSEEYPLPPEVEAGDYVFAYLLPEKDYRLPNPDLEKPTAKDQNFRVLSNHRRLDRGSDYYYYIEEDGSGFFYIPSQTIDEDITITGDCIQLFTVKFNPRNIDDTDGQWSDGSKDIKTAIVDENTDFGDAFIKTGAKDPESEQKSSGMRFKSWTDKDGNTISSTLQVNDNLEAFGSYEMTQYHVNYEELYNIKKPEDNPIDFKKDYEITLEPKDKDNYVMPLNKDFVLKRKVVGEETPTTMKEGEDYTYTLGENRSSANFKIYGASVIGNFFVYGRCPEKYTITIDPNGGTVKGETSPWNVTAIQGDTLASLLEQEGIKESEIVPPSEKHFTGWTFNDAEIDKDYQFTVSGTLKATYGNESFETVSWSKLAGQTEKMSFDDLKTYYGVDTFVGMEKKITAPINGDQSKTREVMVRVIGENHDTKTDSNKALLTFEFEEIINKNVPYWTDNDYWNEYEYSDLRKEMASESTMLEELNKFKIASVNKQTMRGGKNDATYKDQVTTEEKLFALSGVEIGISGEQPREKMNPDTTLYNTSRFKEGTVYSYYSVSQVKPSMREKDWFKPAEGEEPAEYVPTSYLLRTPHALSFADPIAKKDQSGFYGIYGSNESQFKDKNGRYDRFHDTAIGIAPAFAI